MKTTAKIFLIVALMLAIVATGALAKKKDKFGWLGIYLESLNDEVVDDFDLDIEDAVIITGIIDDSPADDAGLKEDDIIISFNGKRVYDDDDLIRLVKKTGPDAEVTLSIIRDSDEEDIKVILGSKPYRKNRTFFFNSDDDHDKTFFWNSKKEHARIGVILLDISEETSVNLGTDGYGVMINKVTEDSPADKAGLLPGDIIVKVDDKKVHDISDAVDRIRAKDEDETAKIEIVRNGKRKTIDVGVEIVSSRHFSPGVYSMNLPNDFDFDFDFDDLDLDEIYIDLDDLDIDLRHRNHSNIQRHKIYKDNIKAKLKSFQKELSKKRDVLKYSDEFESTMDELRKEMKQLKKELEELKSEDN